MGILIDTRSMSALKEWNGGARGSRAVKRFRPESPILELNIRPHTWDGPDACLHVAPQHSRKNTEHK